MLTDNVNEENKQKNWSIHKHLVYRYETFRGKFVAIDFFDF